MNAVALQKKENKTSHSRTRKKAPSFFGPTTIQKKLSIGASNDAYEAEADRVADQVVGMSDVQVQKQSNGALVQRKCSACEDEHVQKKSLADGITPLIQKKKSNTVDGGVATNAITSKINSSRGSGRAMDDNTKSFMESRFGTDFSNVRLHTDSNAIQLSQELNAQAFTVGNDIYFNKGKYNTTSTSGKHLLAHELTHTIQQKGMVQRKIQKQEQDDPCTYSTSNVKNREIHLNLTLRSARVYERNGTNFSVAAQFDNLITGPATVGLARQNGWCHMYSVKGHQSLSGMGLINFVNYCGGFGFHSNYWRNGTPRPDTPTEIPGNQSHGCARIIDEDANSTSSDQSRAFFNLVRDLDCVRIYSRSFWRNPTFARCPSAGENCTVNSD